MAKVMSASSTQTKQAPAKPTASKASPNPAKAESKANLKTTFGVPKK